MTVYCQSNSNRTADWTSLHGSSKNDNPLRIVARNEFLFAVGAIAIIFGLLFPPSSHLLDVLLIFAISLTASVLIITFSARSTLQVLSFPLLIVLATMLRMSLSVASAKLLLFRGDAGAIINLFGKVFAGKNTALATLTFCVLVVAVFVIIFKAVKNISRISTDFISQIIPVKQLSINAELNAGAIDSDKAFTLRTELARETGFFIAMTGTARFLLCAAIIELLIIFINTAASIAIGVAGKTTSTSSAQTYATLAIGAGILLQLCAVIAVIASKYLVRKSFEGAQSDDPLEREAAERIKVVASEVASCESRDSQFNSRLIEPLQQQDNIADVDIDAEQATTEDTEWCDESQQTITEDHAADLNASLWKQIKQSDNYDAIADLIGGKTDKPAKTILMAAENPKELPVTVPVNIAMRLAQNNRKVLLVDLDFERNAIAKVFEIEAGKSEAKAIPTCISNLWLLPASEVSKTQSVTYPQVITNIQTKYDHIIIYAPDMRILTDTDKLIDYLGAAMLFGSDKSPSIKNLYKLLTASGCDIDILKPEQILAEAV